MDDPLVPLADPFYSLFGEQVRPLTLLQAPF